MSQRSSPTAAAPAPVFIGAEKGSAELDVARFPQPQTWSEFGEALRTLHSAEHSYQTVVIDTLDWLEPLAHVDVVASYNANASHPSVLTPSLRASAQALLS